MHAHIYKRGNHADSAIKRSAEGTGLGRAATKLLLYVVCIGITTKCCCVSYA